MRSEDVRIAAGLPFFDGVGPASIEELTRDAYLQRFPAHVDLIRQGERPDFLHVVVEGRVEEFSHYRGRQTTVNVLSPGDCFILAAVYLDKAYLKSARSITPVRMLLVPAAAVRAVFTSDPVFAGKLAAELARGYRTLVKEVGNLKLRSSVERLANWLLHQAGSCDGPSASFAMPFDKKTLAAKLGIAPEVLSRNFAALAPYGVAVNGKAVEVRDIPLLASLAQPSSTIDDPGF